jgi:hypothetical protein
MGCIVFRREGGRERERKRERERERERGDENKYGVGLEALKYCL